MTDITTGGPDKARPTSDQARPTVVEIPSRGRILKATLVALVVAAIVLVTAVLPAEYGIDPLGTGAAMGLTGMTAAAPPPIAPAAGGPITTRQLPFKVDAIELTIEPRRYVEYKYQLTEGATMLYSWRATGPVEVDFHTEPAGKPPEASDSFERASAQTGGRGSYRAPYGGIHGWYWENKGDQSVTITLQTAGFYSQARLFSDTGSSEPREVKEPAPPAALQ
jgi:hypothetical protein